MRFASHLVEASEPAHRFRFEYVLVYADPEGNTDVTPFFGYPIGLVEMGYAFGVVGQLPRDATELFTSRSERVEHRIAHGGYQVSAVAVDQLAAFVSTRMPWLCCVLSASPELAAVAERELTSLPDAGRFVLHATPQGTRFGPLGMLALRAYVMERIADTIGRMPPAPPLKLDPSSAMASEGISTPFLSVDQSAPLLPPRPQRMSAIEREGVLAPIDDSFSSEMDVESAAGLRDAIAAQEPDPATTLPWPLQLHHVTLANVIALTGSRFNFMEPTLPPLAASRQEPYEEAMWQAHDEVLRQRSQCYLSSPGTRTFTPYELLLAVPAAYKSFYSPKELFGPVSSSGARRRLQQAMGALQSSTNLAAYSTPDAIPHSVLPEHTPVQFAETLAVRQLELKVFFAVLGLRASANVTPTIVLPPAAADVRHKLANLTSTAEAFKTGPTRRKLNAGARALSAQLGAALPNGTLKRLRAVRSVKLVGDAPLEWVPLDGLPLSLRVDCSRIPSTPGDLWLAEMATMTDLPLAKTAFDEVLVVRSFRDDVRADKAMKPLLEEQIEFRRRSTRAGMPRVRIVDVRTRAELIAALQAYDGAWLVYDGHGTHPTSAHDRLAGHADIGVLRLAGEDVQPWSLRGEARIPPIVLLSACETHAFSGSHATAANGFLAAGAHTVVGTSLPVDARESASFVARVINLVHGYQAEANSRSGSFATRWSQVFAGMQRRVFVSEAVHAINGHDGIRLSDSILFDVMHPVQLAIARGDSAWYDLLVAQIADHSGVPANRVAATLSREAYLTHALLYVQLGNPDRVLVTAGLDAE